MLTADGFREIVLALPGSSEGAHMGHPDFRANGRIFASLDAGERQATLKLSAEEQQAFIDGSPQCFAPAAGAWGRQGWTIVRLAEATAALVRPTVLIAWERVNALPPPKTRTGKVAAGRRRPPGRESRAATGSARGPGGSGRRR